PLRQLRRLQPRHELRAPRAAPAHLRQQRGGPRTGEGGGMSNQIAKLGVGLLLCFLVLFVQLNRVTVFGAQDLKDNPVNNRSILRDFDAPRGTIVTADEVIAARSEPTPEGSRFEFARTYPEGDLFAHTVGYFSLNLGATGVEDTYNAELAGRTLDLSFRSLDDLFVDRDRVGDVRLTLRADVQR